MDRNPTEANALKWRPMQSWVGTTLLLLLVIGVRLLLPQDWAFPFIPFAMAVPIAEYLFGVGPGLLFTLVGGLVAIGLTPNWSAHLMADLAGYLFLVGQALVIGWIIWRLQTTKRRLAVEDLLHRNILKEQSDWISRMDGEGRFTYLNPAAAVAFGLSETAAIGQHWAPATLPEDKAAVEAKLATLSPANPVVVVVNRIRGSEGQVIWGHFVNHGVFDERGALISILSVGRDITELKMLEEELAKTSVELKDLYDVSPAGLYSLRPDGLLLKANRRMSEWLGVPLEDLVGKRRITEFFDEDGLKVFAENFPKLMDLGYAKDLRVNLICGDGSRKAVLVNGIAKYDVNGAFLFSRSVMTDISELIRAEEELERLNRELEARIDERTAALSRKTAELESFTYSLSHDLRAPLRRINTTLAISLEDHAADITAPVRADMAQARKISEQMSELMDGLLALSKVTSGGFQIASIDQASLVGSVLEGLGKANHVGAKEVIVGVMPPAVGDARLVRQVWQNLLLNALKFSGRMVARRIEVGYRDDSKAYFVRDNGIGFDMKHAGKLFQPFQRMHKDIEGAGVGLALASEIIKRHGGRIWCDSSPGNGATFYFTLDEHSPAEMVA